LAYNNALFTAPGLLSSLLFTLDVMMWSTLVVIIVYDLKHMIIPDSLSAFFVALTTVRLAVFWKFGLVTGYGLLAYALAGLVLSGFFFALWLVSSGRWIGLGDAKIAVGMGLYLGLAQGLSSFAFAFWIGATFALTKMFFSFIVGKLQLSKGEKSITMKSEIPFAPFLILGMLLAYVLGSNIFHLPLFIS
jgi:prepilin signal peptidase PulO-like enzyme (type II secretory pathway)